MRKLIVVPIVALLFGVTASAALASGLHFKSGPVFSTSSPTTVSVSGEVAGAGTSISASLSVNYTFTVTCNNPGNDAGPVPGKGGSGTTTGAELNIPAVHGNASFSLSTAAAAPDTSKSCNANWTANGPVITFTNATLTITSSNGGTLTATHTF